jgi:hypothetical protein
VRGIAVLGALAALLAVPAADAAPALRPLDEAPLVLRGTGFRPLERVSVKALRRDGDPIVKRAVAARNGTFTVRFDLALDPCTGTGLVLAVGKQGSRARLLVSPLRRPCVAPVVPG